MSLANVSNISVISLPIAVNELTNGEHYGRVPIGQPLLHGSEFARLGFVGPAPADNHGKIAALNPYGPITPKSIAILGTSLSGKTTVRRQIQALYGDGFSDSEREEARASIFDNLRTASLLVYFKIGHSSIKLSTLEHKHMAALYPHHEIDKKNNIWDHATVVRYVKAFRSLLSIPAVRRLMHSEDWQGVNDNIEFFSRRFESLFIEDCTVADIDVFHASTGPTLQSYSDEFSLGRVQYQITDHGATSGERTKRWRKSASNADVILFTVALPGYYRCTPDDSAVNQMVDAMNAFQDVVNASDAPIILLFTKYDLLRDSLEVQPFTDFFPEYNGLMDNDADHGVAMYLASRFLELDQRSHGGTYLRSVNAADPDDFKAVFEQVMSEILGDRLNHHHRGEDVRRQKDVPSEAYYENRQKRLSSDEELKLAIPMPWL